MISSGGSGHVIITSSLHGLRDIAVAIDIHDPRRIVELLTRNCET